MAMSNNQRVYTMLYCTQYPHVSPNQFASHVSPSASTPDLGTPPGPPNRPRPSWRLKTYGDRGLQPTRNDILMFYSNGILRILRNLWDFMEFNEKSWWSYGDLMGLNGDFMGLNGKISVNNGESLIMVDIEWNECRIYPLVVKHGNNKQ